MPSRPRPPRGGLVYSTELGRTCPECRQQINQCRCRHSTAVPTGDGVVRVGRETSGRKGKGVTVVKGVLLAPADLDALGTHLKKRCGSGGTVKDGVIEIQGDHRDVVIAELTARGMKVKRVGG
ncbi:MAG: translation initiation factor Sui1 [Gemmatimonadales bacterium]